MTTFKDMLSFLFNIFTEQKVGKKQTNVRESNQVLFWGIKRKTPTMLNQKDLYVFNITK